MEIFNIKGISSFKKICCVMCILISLLPDTRTFYITNIIVPSFVDVKDVATLSCSYNLGNQKLNSVKWYKNDKEFYRYSPLMPNNERQRIFNVEGVHVSHDYFCNNKSCTIHLDNLHFDTSGFYRCEVSGDAPEFKLVHDGNNMSIVAFPQKPPLLEGLENVYSEGEYLFGNCSSDFSYPAPIMSWYINDQKADQSLLQPYHELKIEANGLNLTKRSLEIRFSLSKEIVPTISNNRRVNIKCIVQIRQLPTQIREAEHTFYIKPAYEPHKLEQIINWKNSATAFSLMQSILLLNFIIIGFHVKIIS